MDSVVLLDDLSVVGETVITELMLTLDTYEKEVPEVSARIDCQIVGFGVGWVNALLPPLCPGEWSLYLPIPQ